jgi:chromosome condensin MukBEF ATPase and DNA-binding subunit MukB
MARRGTKTAPTADEPKTAEQRKAQAWGGELGQRLKGIQAERSKAEAEYMKRQAKLVEVEEDYGRGSKEYNAQLDKVNEVRAEIGRIGDEQAQVSSAFSIAAGGKVFQPDPKAP